MVTCIPPGRILWVETHWPRDLNYLEWIERGFKVPGGVGWRWNSMFDDELAMRGKALFE